MREGQPTGGVTVEKNIPTAPVPVTPRSEIKPILPLPQPPKITAPPVFSPTPSPKMGPVLPPKPEIITPPSLGGINVPGGGYLSPRLFLIGALIVLLAGFSTWYFVIRQPAEITVSPTPSEPTVTEITLEDIFPVSTTVINFSDYADVGSPAQKFASQLGLSVNQGEFERLSGAKNGLAETRANGFMDSLLVRYPFEMKTAFSDDSGTFIYGQKEAFDISGQMVTGVPASSHIVMISEIKAGLGINQTLNSWEASMIGDLSNLFGLEKNKASSGIFSDNNYRSTPIRFRNFPFADSTIDYGIVSAGGKRYFILTSSREAMFATIDQILDFSPSQ